MPEQAASRTKRTNRLNCDEGWITVLKCVFIANLILDVKSWRHTVAEKDNVAEKNVHQMQLLSVTKYECAYEAKKLRSK